MRMKPARAIVSAMAVATGVLGTVTGMSVAQAQPAGPSVPIVVSVPCSVPALISAITTANAAIGPSILNLSPTCTYVLTTVNVTGSNGPDGLPIITNDITLHGGATIITRSGVAPPFRIFEIGGAGAKLTVQSVRVSNGEAGDGGCYLVDDSASLVLTNSIVSDCSAEGEGGGVYIGDSAFAAISASLLRGNLAGDDGGAISNEPAPKSDEVNVTPLVISYPSLVIGNTHITNNVAYDEGGGIYNNGPMVLGGSAVGFNFAVTDGGGIANYDDEILQNTAVSGNASVTGGGIWEDGDTALINSLVSGNFPNNCRPFGSIPLCIN